MAWSVSRVTVRKALATLEQEGLITARAGRGRTVRQRRSMVYRPQADEEPRRSKVMDRFMTSLSEEGRNPSQVIDIKIEGADRIVAERYGVPEGTSMAVRRRVRSIDGEPFNINDTYYLLELVKDTPIMNPADIPEGSNAVITRLIGREVRAIDEYYVRMPTPAESTRLMLPPGTPVAVHYLTGYTADDKVGRVERSTYSLGTDTSRVRARAPGATGLKRVVTVRRANNSEVNVVADMWVRAATALAHNGMDQWQYPVKVHNIRAAIDAGNCWLASDQAGDLIGTITVDRNADPAMWFPEDHPDDALYLHRMITEPAATGAELSSALIDWAARRAVDEGCKWVRLDGWRSNRRLRKYYTDCGIEFVRVVPDPSGSGACFQRDATVQLGHGPEIRET